MEGNKLVDLLFGTKSVYIPRQLSTKNVDESKDQSPPELKGHQTKRVRVEVKAGIGWEENQLEKGLNKKQPTQSSGTANLVEFRGGRQQADGPVGNTQVDGLGEAQQYHGEATSNLNAKDETPLVTTRTPLVGTLCNSISQQTPLVS